MRLGNIKGFEETGDVEIRPLTLFIGENSSGKSSIMRFPLVLRQTILDDSMAPLLFYGRSIDYGGFSDVIFNHQTRRRAEFQVTIDPSSLDHVHLRKLHKVLRGAESPRLTMRVQVGKLDDNLIVYKFGVGIEGRKRELIEVARCRDGRYRLKASRVRSTQTFEFTTSTLTFDKFLPDIRPILMEARPDTVTPVYNIYDELYDLYYILNNYWTSFANSVSYIGPFRRTPERAYRHKDNAVFHVGSDGEFAPVVLAQNHRSRGSLVEDVSQWLYHHLGFKLRVDELGGDMFRIMIVDTETGAENNIIDVGYGLSQLIPVVIQTLIARRLPARHPMSPPGFDLVLVEQPELHLHPAAQAKLADLFLEGISRYSATNRQKKYFLIETHSEHMLLRFRRFVAEGRLSPNDIAIYYTSKNPETKRNDLKRLDIENDGSISGWPKGFFDQDYQEALALRRAVLEQQAKTVQKP